MQRVARFWTCSKCRALLQAGTRTCPYCGTDQRHQAALSPTEEVTRTVRVASWALGINLAIFALMIVLDPARGDLSLEPSRESVDMFGILRPIWIADCAHYWRFLSCVFMHLGLLHLVLNCAALTYIAPLAAATFGPHRAVGIYVLGGLGASYASYLNLSFLGGSAGASGAICALIGALGAYGKRRGGLQGDALARQMLTWALLVVALGFLVPRIDNAGHLGGLVGGALLGWIAAQPRAWGGAIDRLWRLTAHICVLLVLVVFGAWMVPSVARGLEKDDVIFFRNETRQILKEIGIVLTGERTRDRLPESLGSAAGGAEPLGLAMAEALSAARARAPLPELEGKYRGALVHWLDGDVPVEYRVVRGWALPGRIRGSALDRNSPFLEQVRALDAVRTVIEAERTRDALPGKVLAAEGGGEEVREAIATVLGAVRSRPPSPDAVEEYDRAARLWVAWRTTLKCRYCILPSDG